MKYIQYLSIFQLISSAPECQKSWWGLEVPLSSGAKPMELEIGLMYVKQVHVF